MTTKPMATRRDPAELLFAAVPLRLLAPLLMRPEESFHLREIARLSGVDAGNAQRALKRMEQAGLVKAARSGNQLRYQANADNPIFPELQGIVRKTVGLADVLREALSPLAETIERAFVFGSIARGDAGPRSDVDVMIVGDATFEDVVAAIHPLQERFGRDVNPVVMSVDEFRARTQDAGFVRRVLDGPRILLFGGAHDA
jgi:predicted nucleotidyltransferase